MLEDYVHPELPPAPPRPMDSLTVSTSVMVRSRGVLGLERAVRKSSANGDVGGHPGEVGDEGWMGIPRLGREE